MLNVDLKLKLRILLWIFGRVEVRKKFQFVSEAINKFFFLQTVEIWSILRRKGAHLIYSAETRHSQLNDFNP